MVLPIIFPPISLDILVEILQVIGLLSISLGFPLIIG
jgi:hypothetical protein